MLLGYLVGGGWFEGSLAHSLLFVLSDMQRFGNSEMVPSMLCDEIAIRVLMTQIAVHLVPNGASHCVLPILMHPFIYRATLSL